MPRSNACLHGADAQRLVASSLLTAAADVLRDFVRGDLGCLGRRIEIVLRNVPVVAVSLVRLAATTTHTHVDGSLRSGGNRGANHHIVPDRKFPH